MTFVIDLLPDTSHCSDVWACKSIGPLKVVNMDLPDGGERVGADVQGAGLLRSVFAEVAEDITVGNTMTSGSPILS